MSNILVPDVEATFDVDGTLAAEMGDGTYALYLDGTGVVASETIGYSGWIWSLDGELVGGDIVFTFTIKAPIGAAAGTYSVRQLSLDEGWKSASFIIEGPDPPPTPTLTATPGRLSCSQPVIELALS